MNEIPNVIKPFMILHRTSIKTYQLRRVSEKMQKIRDSLKLIQRNGEVAAHDLSPFSYEDFEKIFIYNNPLFRQRKYIKDVVVKASANNEFDYSPFYKKFPLLADAIPELGTIGFTYLSYLKNYCRKTELVQRLITAVVMCL